ncbi:hypothetical protein C8R44DRAFT_20767 [Mycena epipterygia]|nr:hypothetical protein C8R44DRAFT_20767 [Mycena epipterygia]
MLKCPLENVPTVQRVLIAYIVNLILVLEQLFSITLQFKFMGTVSWDTLREAFEAHHNSTFQHGIHKEVRALIEQRGLLSSDLFGVRKSMEGLVKKYSQIIRLDEAKDLQELMGMVEKSEVELTQYAVKADPGPISFNRDTHEGISTKTEAAERSVEVSLFTTRETSSGVHPEIASTESNLPATAGAGSTPLTTAETHTPIFTFVIYSPRSSRGNAPSYPDPYGTISAEDIQAFEARVSQGTPISSVHSPDDALLWVETHYDHSLLKAIRAHGLGGPIAAMLSPDEPALAIFGSILDGWVHEAAKLLADVSSLLVMIRPFADDPAQWWHLAPDAAEDEEIISDANEADEILASEDEMESDESETTESDTHSINIGSTGVFRLRGGADEAKFTPWTSLEHNLDMCWDIKSGDEVYKVDLLTKIQFTVQSKYKDHSGKKTRPQAISRTEHTVIPRHRNVRSNRSYSRIAFVADAYISKCIALPSDRFTRPNQITTISTTEGNQKTGTASFAVGMNPNVGGTFGGTQSSARTTANENDRVTPQWIVDYEHGDRWETGTKYYSAQNISYTATDGNQRGIDVEFSVGINVQTAEPMDSDLPRTTFIIQNQTILWLPNKHLKAGGHEIVILTTSYIKDIGTDEELWIKESQTVELASGSLINPPATDTNPATYNAQLSLAIAVPSPKNEPSLFKRLTDKLIREFLNNRKKPPLDSLIPELPLQELKARGWDEETKEWRMPAFPNLTSALARAEKHSPGHVWNLKMPDLSTHNPPNSKEKQDAEAGNSKKTQDNAETAATETSTDRTNPDEYKMEEMTDEEINRRVEARTGDLSLKSKGKQRDLGGRTEEEEDVTESGTALFIDPGMPSTDGHLPVTSGAGSNSNSLTSAETHALGGQFEPHAGTSKA